MFSRLTVFLWSTSHTTGVLLEMCQRDFSSHHKVVFGPDVKNLAECGCRSGGHSSLQTSGSLSRVWDAQTRGQLWTHVLDRWSARCRRAARRSGSRQLTLSSSSSHGAHAPRWSPTDAPSSGTEQHTHTHQRERELKHRGLKTTNSNMD